MKGLEPRAWTGVHVIADAGACLRGGAAVARTPLDVAQAALAGGAGVVQVRLKGGPSRALYAEARGVSQAVRKHAAARLVVNDRLDVALAVNADAVHLGQDDLSPEDARRVIAAEGSPMAYGLSTHDRAQARRAAEAGAAYIGFGPVFQTDTKTDAMAPRGLDLLAEVCRTVEVPVIAIGGIDLEGARAVAAAGAAGVAVISAVANAPDMTAATRALVAIFPKSC